MRSLSDISLTNRSISILSDKLELVYTERIVVAKNVNNHLSNEPNKFHLNVKSMIFGIF